MSEPETRGLERRPLRRSFALRLAAAFAGIGIASAALTAILVNLAFGGRFSGYLERQQRVRQEQLAAALAESYRRMGGWDGRDLQALAPMAFMEGGTLRLLDRSGRAVWTPSPEELGGGMAAMHRQMMGMGGLGPERTVPIVVSGSRVGTALVRLPQPGVLPQDASFRAGINRLLLGGGIAAGLVALLLGALLARRAVAPVRELARAAGAFAAGDRSHRLDDRSGDEFGDMARAFNRMSEAVEEEDRLRRVFAAEVAHELRTPLAILLSEIEAMQDGVLRPSRGQLASLHDETLRLARLVGDLEALASADSAGFSLSLQPVELHSLLQKAVDELAGRFEAAGLHVQTDLEDVSAPADPTRLRQVVANLLTNALKFTPPGGLVRIRLRTQGPDAVIEVADSGVGIPPDELPHVFDRFFRGRAARAGGSGIGLTVVRELVGAHGGAVAIESGAEVGTRVTVRLPGAAPRPREPVLQEHRSKEFRR